MSMSVERVGFLLLLSKDFRRCLPNREIPRAQYFFPELRIPFAAWLVGKEGCRSFYIHHDQLTNAIKFEGDGRDLFGRKFAMPERPEQGTVRNCGAATNKDVQS